MRHCINLIVDKKLNLSLKVMSRTKKNPYQRYLSYVMTLLDLKIELTRLIICHSLMHQLDLIEAYIKSPDVKPMSTKCFSGVQSSYFFHEIFSFMDPSMKVATQNLRLYWQGYRQMA